MRYALIENGKVVNLIWLYEKNACDFPAAVPAEGLPTQIGDDFSTGKFYRDGKAVLSPLAETQEELADTERDMAALVEMIFQNDMEVIG